MRLPLYNPYSSPSILTAFELPDVMHNFRQAALRPLHSRSGLLMLVGKKLNPCAAKYVPASAAAMDSIYEGASVAASPPPTPDAISSAPPNRRGSDSPMSRTDWGSSASVTSSTCSEQDWSPAHDSLCRSVCNGMSLAQTRLSPCWKWRESGRIHGARCFYSHAPAAHVPETTTARDDVEAARKEAQKEKIIMDKIRRKKEREEKEKKEREEKKKESRAAQLEATRVRDKAKRART